MLPVKELLEVQVIHAQIYVLFIGVRGVAGHAVMSMSSNAWFAMGRFCRLACALRSSAGAGLEVDSAFFVDPDFCTFTLGFGIFL